MLTLGEVAPELLQLRLTEPSLPVFCLARQQSLLGHQPFAAAAHVRHSHYMKCSAAMFSAVLRDAIGMSTSACLPCITSI